MKPVFADTFYYLALVNKNDAFHDKAVNVARNLQVPVLTTAWVIVEVADALADTNRRSTLAVLFQSLKNDPAVTIVPPECSLYEAGLDLYMSRPDKGWSLTDCISFTVMEQRQLIDALTADHHFQQAGYRALMLEDIGE